MLNQKKFLLPGIAWGILIFLLSTAPGKSMPNLSFFDIFQPDKVAHLFVYFVLVSLFLWGLKKNVSPDKIPKNWIAMVLFIAISYGIFIEWVQYAFFPGRYFELFDIIANIIGCLTGLICLNVFKKINI